MNKSKVKNGVILLLMVFSHHVLAQKNKESVVFMKNGSVFRGKTLIPIADTAVQLKLFNGNEINLLKVDIQEIKIKRIRRHDLFAKEKQKLVPRFCFTGSINFTGAFHTSFGNTKTIANQFLVDAEIRFKNILTLSVGTGIISYTNLSPNKNRLINGKNDYLAYSINNDNMNSTNLNHLPVYLNMAAPFINFKKASVELFLKGGYFFYHPESYTTLVTYRRRNNNIVYNLGFDSEYLQRNFLNSGFNYIFKSSKDQIKFTAGIGYYIDFMQINYNYKEENFIFTNPMNSYQGYWKINRYTEKINAHLHMVTINIGTRF